MSDIMFTAYSMIVLSEVQLAMQVLPILGLGLNVLHIRYTNENFAKLYEALKKRD